jgi:hypothetical protein
VIIFGAAKRLLGLPKKVPFFVAFRAAQKSDIFRETNRKKHQASQQPQPAKKKAASFLKATSKPPKARLSLGRVHIMANLPTWTIPAIG